MQTAAKRHPRFWRKDGNNLDNCTLTVDEMVTCNGLPSCFIRNDGTEPGDKAGIIQTIGAYEFRGKRMQFRGKMRTQNVFGTAAFFVYVLDVQPSNIISDDMSGREISGDNDWTEMSIVLDVPEEARYINFGAQIEGGPGSIWIGDLTISEVGLDVPVTEPGLNGDDVEPNFELAARADDSERAKDWLFYSNPRNASGEFKNGLCEEDGRPALFISSDSPMVPQQGEKSSLAGRYSISFNGAPWRNKRVRVSADMKYSDVGDWCGLMMWVHNAGHKTVAFSTMYDRALCGDSDWSRHGVVLDVPATGYKITLAATLDGNGKVYFSNFIFEEVSGDEPTTDRCTRAKNLDFSE